MALTYRSAKGSALTINELDNNFRYFTGSHAVTGSFVAQSQRPITSSTTNVTMSAGIAGYWLNMGGSSTMTASVFPNSEVSNIPIGSEFIVLSTGSAQIYVTASRVTTIGTVPRTGGAGDRWTIKKLDTDLWYFASDVL